MAYFISWPYDVRFFLWGYVKNKVDIPPMPQELRERMCIAVDSFHLPMLAGVRDNLQNRFDACPTANGRHTEHWRELRKF